MNAVKSRGLLVVITVAMLMGASSVALAKTSVKGMKNCENALLERPKFKGLPMAAFSIRPGADKHHARFTVSWEGLKSAGHCKLTDKDKVENISVKSFHDGRKAKHNGGHPHDRDGFYYDTHIGKWRDPDGRVCHTCTPENGFPKPSHYRN